MVTVLVTIDTTSSYGIFTSTCFSVWVNVNSNATVGTSNITITNPDGGYCTVTNGFSAVHTPDVQSVTVSPGGSNIISAGLVGYTTMTVVGKGAYFESGLKVWFSTSSKGYPVDSNISTGTIGNFSASSFQLYGTSSFRQHAIYSNIRERVYSDK